MEIFRLVGAKKRSLIVEKRSLADAIIKVVNDYVSRYGATSDRKVFYLLLNIPGLLRNDVRKTPFLNDNNCYQDVTDMLTRLRLDGSIPFEAIEDETRPVVDWMSSWTISCRTTGETYFNPSQIMWSCSSKRTRSQRPSSRLLRSTPCR
jgi:hypothetical protein